MSQIIHLTSMISPDKTICQVSINNAFSTSDGDFFVAFAKEQPRMVCEDCVHNGLYEDVVDEIYDAIEDAYLDTHMEGVIGGW